MRLLLNNYTRDNRGAVSVETAFLSAVIFGLIGAGVEAGYAFAQWNTAQQAARMGARVAATSTSVSDALLTNTGLGGGVSAGDPMPDYSYVCSGHTARCSSGTYNSTAMNAIVFGPDNDGTCAQTARERMGICDMFDRVDLANVTVTYDSSGLGVAGNPADPAPLVTVSLSDISFDFLFLDLFAPGRFKTMPQVSVTLMGEDLKTGT